MKSNRRQFLGLALGGPALAAAAVSARGSEPTTKTSAHIVILGAGAAGTALANRLASRFEGAKITIIDARKARKLFRNDSRRPGSDVATD